MVKYQLAISIQREHEGFILESKSDIRVFPKLCNLILANWVNVKMTICRFGIETYSML